MNFSVAVLKRPKVNGFVDHIGLYLSDSMVAHNTPEKGEHISSLAEFAGGEQVTVVAQLDNPPLASIRSVLEQVRTNPQKYDAVSNNCEHFVTRLLGNKSESRQLQGIVIGTIAAISVVLFLIYLSKRK